MFDSIPDPIEQLENWEERMIEQYGNPDGTVRCVQCGRTILPGKERQIGESPHVLPICERCNGEI